MTVIYTATGPRPNPPTQACQGRCARCIADALADHVPGTFLYRSYQQRQPTCRNCQRHDCKAAESCAYQCNTPPDQITPPNRQTIILPEPPITPPPPNR